MKPFTIGCRSLLLSGRRSSTSVGCGGGGGGMLVGINDSGSVRMMLCRLSAYRHVTGRLGVGIKCRNIGQYTLYFVYVRTYDTF